MEKLSSIIPSNARLKSVDMEDAHPVRPGTPTLGRPVGLTSSQRDRVTLSSQAKDQAFNETLARRNPRDEQGVKIVKSITDQFFMNRIGPKAEAEVVPTLSESVAGAQVDIATAPQLIVSVPVYTDDGQDSAQVSSGQLIDKNA